MDSSIAANSVQHVNKKSSDELLSKFAELGSESGGEINGARKLLLRVVKRGRRRGRMVRENDQCDSPLGGAVVERKWLIPPAARKCVMLKKLGIGRSQQLKVRDFRNKSILGAIEKTWRRTVEGASKVLLEKHYNTHRRLISDVV